MNRDRSLKLLRDAHDAGAAVIRFAEAMSYDDYLENDLVRSAVERKFMIVGEALTQLAKTDPELAKRIPEIDRIRAFRNELVHAYFNVNDDVVWSAVRDALPRLMTQLARLISDVEAARQA